VDSQEGNNLNNELIEKHIREAKLFKFIQTLSEEAKELLIEASKDPYGTVIKRIIGATGGFSLKTNGKNLVKEAGPRAKALWESTLQELLDNDLLAKQGLSGTVFEITHKGFQIIDSFNKNPL